MTDSLNAVGEASHRIKQRDISSLLSIYFFLQNIKNNENINSRYIGEGLIYTAVDNWTSNDKEFTG